MTGPALIFFSLVLASSLVHADQLVVGQVAPLSGLDANQGRAYASGMQLMFSSVNQAGGVNGHTLLLVTRDDGGLPRDTLSATRALLAQSRPLVLAGYFGSQNIRDLAASGLLETSRLALVGYRSKDVQPETPFLYGVRANMADEIGKMSEHLATIGITRLGLLYEEGQGAASLLALADAAAKKAHVGFIARASYPASTARVAPAVEALVAAGPQAIIMVASGAAAAGFIEQYRGAGGSAQLFAHSGADIEQLSKRLSEEQMQGVAIAQVTPSPYKITGLLVKEFRDKVARAQAPEAPVSYAMMEGYIAAKVIVEAIRRQGARPSREGMVAALDGMKNHDLGGYVVGFRPGMRSGSSFVELTIISSGGKIRQ